MPVKLLPAILALLTAAAGWYYMFYSRAAHGLSDYENPELNHRRILLRRIGGGAMFLLGIAFYAGFELMDRQAPVLFALTWAAIALLMFAVVTLGLIDLRLTLRLRRRDRDEP